MNVRVRLFASLREQAGWGERLIGVASAEATPGLLWHLLQLPAGPAAGQDDRGAEASPAAQGPCADGDATLPEGIRVAINQAFLPPISGG